jgi:tRNA threonylcarbamoyl adenosine modification protein YjeE
MIPQAITTSEDETAALAADFARSIKAGDCVLFWGDLGAGKSVFCRSMIRAMCGDPALEVPSPTFTLVQTYPAAAGMVWHFDLYRLCEPSEVYEIGWEEARSGGIILLEWPERLGALLPRVRIDVRLELVPDQPNHRKVSIVRHGE